MFRSLLVALLLTFTGSGQAATLPLVWVNMATTTAPQILWLPQDVDGVRFTGTVKVEGDWDVLPGGWKSLHRVTQGKGVQASPLQSRLARETGGRVSLIFMAPADQQRTSCLVGTTQGRDVTRLCLRAVEGEHGGSPLHSP